MKKRLFALAVIIICLSLTAYGTLAYFTTEEAAHNVITSSSISIDLQEWADEDKTEPFPEDGVSGVMPGAEVIKIADVVNDGAEPVWIRVSVEKSIQLAEGVEGDIDISLLELSMAEDWTLEEDGYYYYANVVQPGEVINVFGSVSFSVEMGNMYQNSDAIINVIAEAIQAANTGSSAQEAFGLLN